MRSKTKLLSVAGALVMLGTVVASASPVQAANDDREPEPKAASVIAIFEGDTFDMSQGWGEAGACLVSGDLAMPECFRTEGELDERLAELEGSQASARSMSPSTTGPLAAASSACASSLRLYKNSYYGGSVLHLSSIAGWLNLSNYAFNQTTSSFKVGACDVRFADLSNGGGAWYASWRTDAYDVGPTMVSGWDNDVSSVRIY